MSSDQRPGKVRVFSSGMKATVPASPSARRRGDRIEEAPSSVPPTPVVGPALKGRFLLLAGLFLLGCAIGGALLAWSGLMGPKG
ncbi:hypothetical protein [Sphingobium sp.]|uniref:hypothetical protein n=1 Tax=Sphingobium sp. TaxID=1912891 RepID=UPI0035C73EEC